MEAILHRLLCDGCGDAVLFQNLGKISLGCFINSGFVHDIYLLLQPELGAVVGDLSYDRINVIGFFGLCFLCPCKRYIGKYHGAAEDETQQFLESGQHHSSLLLQYVFQAKCFAVPASILSNFAKKATETLRNNLHNSQFGQCNCIDGMKREKDEV